MHSVSMPVYDRLQAVKCLGTGTSGGKQHIVYDRLQAVKCLGTGASGGKQQICDVGL